MEDGKNEISTIINNLSAEFDKLIISNPYLVSLLCKKNATVSYVRDGKRIEHKYNASKFEKLETYKWILIFIIGFMCCSALIALACVTYKKYPDLFPAWLYSDGEAFSALAKAMPIVVSFFSVFIAFGIVFLRVISKDDYFTNKVVIALLLDVVITFITSYAIKFNYEILLYSCPFLGCLVLITSLLLIYSPLSSKELNANIIKYSRQLLSKLDSLNSSTVLSSVQKSHSGILDRIKDVENDLRTGSQDDLARIQSLTVLDSLRLQLIQNSLSGINLVEDWGYLDLSQKMIDEIMSCENNRIVILGDMSFLSTEKGLNELVKAIQEKGKSFDILFTGDRKKRDESKLIESMPCQEFVDRIRTKYSSNSDILTAIKNHIELYPIPSHLFTGIGFIGLLENNRDKRDPKYEKVYAFISSHLISNDKQDITRANPFVFCWHSDNKTYLFSDFIEKNLLTNNKIKVWIDGEAKNRTDILNFDQQTGKTQSSGKGKKTPPRKK